MIYAVALLTVLCFLVAFERLGVNRAATQALRTSRAAASSIRDASLTDSEKERILRQASLSLMKDVASIGLRSIAALGVSLTLLLGAEVAGLANSSAVIAWLATWEAIALITALVGLGYWARRRF